MYTSTESWRIYGSSFILSQEVFLIGSRDSDCTYQEGLFGSSGAYELTKYSQTSLVINHSALQCFVNSKDAVAMHLQLGEGQPSSKLGLSIGGTMKTPNPTVTDLYKTSTNILICNIRPEASLSAVSCNIPRTVVGEIKFSSDSTTPVSYTHLTLPTILRV